MKVGRHRVRSRESLSIARTPGRAGAPTSPPVEDAVTAAGRSRNVRERDGGRTDELAWRGKSS